MTSRVPSEHHHNRKRAERESHLYRPLQIGPDWIALTTTVVTLASTGGSTSIAISKVRREYRMRSVYRR